MRIQGELLKLGIGVSATTIATVSRSPGRGPAPRRIGPTWSQFLRAQAHSMVGGGLNSGVGDRLEGAASEPDRRRLFARDLSGFAGSHFSLAPGAGFEYDPVRKRIPLMIGTWRPRMAALAGEVADEVKIGGCANPKMVELMRSWIGSDDIGIVVGAVTVVDEDGDAARERARREVARYLEVVGSLDPTIEGQRPFEKFTIAGTPEEVAAHALRLYEAGVKRVEFGTPQGLTTARGVELLCDRVLPLLK